MMVLYRRLPDGTLRPISPTGENRPAVAELTDSDEALVLVEPVYPGGPELTMATIRLDDRGGPIVLVEAWTAMVRSEHL